MSPVIPARPLGAALAALALATPGHAQTAPVVRSETVVEARHDLFGEPIVPLYQFLHLDAGGPVAVESYVSFAAIPPQTGPSLGVYALSLRGTLGEARWKLGTQQGATDVRPQTFDGASIDVPLSRWTSVTAWGGWARHHDLDDPTAGIGVGRAELRYLGPTATLRAGAQLEAPTASGALAVREDGLFAVHHPSGASATASAALAQVLGETPGLERARGEVAARLAPGWTASTWVERRRTEVETLLADDILPLFATGAVDEVGVRARAIGPRLASATASYAIARYAPNDAPALSHRVDAAWAPGPGRPWPTLAWRWRMGPGGAYHALSASRTIGMGRNFAAVTGALVPYRKGSAAWRLAGTAGGDLGRRFGRVGFAQVGADVASDAVWALDVRAHAALTLEWR